MKPIIKPKTKQTAPPQRVGPREGVGGIDYTDAGLQNQFGGPDAYGTDDSYADANIGGTADIFAKAGMGGTAERQKSFFRGRKRSR